ncbi:nuclear transport factor 2 family protein [Sphingomonas montanisoli]|uniref:Nuclear transport factor 2 family protein n=1 Tax=Sphingomonas montanisoli TaxID=2606412 RepID=A0A5D9C822_9SPHN|nr:nuclear transport factor 2 family protein [Sphingomonas montanisoli]TZG27924.1 nuclear transport factor 2 family protein [Sphingomonas montanisoli]
MTMDEVIARECIRDTIARYNMNGDRMRTDAFLACFTEDAVYQSDVFDLHGRDAIRDWMAGNAGPSDGPRVKFVRHHITTCLIDMDGPDAADVRTYYHVYTDTGPDHTGYYVDRFARVGNRWLIAHRKVRTDWARPDSVFIASHAAK